MKIRVLPAIAGVMALLCLPGCSRADRADEGEPRTGSATDQQAMAPPDFETTISGRAVTIGSALSFELAPGPLRIDGAAISAEAGENLPVTVRLATLDAPDSDLAQEVLGQRIAGVEMRLAPDGPGEDRYGRILAQVYLEDADEAVWLQEELVRRGVVRVLSHASNPEAAPYLLRLEANARDAGLGIWAHPAHLVRSTDPDVLAQDEGSVQIVEGRIIEATQLRSGRVYLNFGADYRTDFTVMIAARDAGAFAEAGLSPDRLETRRVRVRGWVELENGPMIRIDHPERLELLPD